MGNLEFEFSYLDCFYGALCAAIPVCVGVAIWDLSHAHPHDHEQIQYPYMHIRTKDFPWGACSLFDTHCWDEQKGGHSEE